jgi:hypothetical protein
MVTPPKDEEVEVQDSVRENQLIQMFKLKKAKGRLGADAFDEYQNPFELKTATIKSVGTGRDVSFEMIANWKKRYWIIAKGINLKSGFVIEKIYFLSPSMMEGALKKIEDHMTPDLQLKDKVIGILKKQIPVQFSTDEIERINYLMFRGSTLNNPKIPWHYIESHGILIKKDYPKTLKALVKKYPLVS